MYISKILENKIVSLTYKIFIVQLSHFKFIQKSNLNEKQQVNVTRKIDTKNVILSHTIYKKKLIQKHFNNKI